MKILLVSMNSIHFRRWSEQLRDSGHEVYWFDILDQGYAPSMSWMTQITGWKKGFLKKRGRTFIKTRLPKLFNALVHKYDTTVEDAFAKTIREIQPDLVHSFALYTSCLPIIDVMNENQNINWLYSSWGSDLFNRSNKPNYNIEVSSVLKRVDYLITDCKRDQGIAVRMGFKGNHLGVFPGGGGFKLEQFLPFRNPIKDRKLLLVKGYENELAKASIVLKALDLINFSEEIQIILFGCENNFVLEHKTHCKNISFLPSISHDNIMELMGKSLIYIGNSVSDGMPNTLLEAISMGAFPIQSNPGGATAEIISHEINGLLIEDPLDTEDIAALIQQAVIDTQMIQKAFKYNQILAHEQLDYKVIKKEVLKTYASLDDLKNYHR
ncbi:glycosyltransferase [uncultured Nonlabens sp.]|uniref:glycosyltransferase n=1 Tax=uncultured Nonlabens sp. TaxID=859306 RepID=UPI002634C251|nr:glycosyltransferase [uncultured Nonlabens sp.]